MPPTASKVSKASKAGSRSPLIRQGDGGYLAKRRLLSEDEILATAEKIIERRFFRLGRITSAADSKRFLRAKLATCEREQFGCLFLDQRFRIIAWEVLFYGTVDGCSVHPREVVKRALARNSTAVVLAHQHPHGDAEPSAWDQRITRELREALALLDIQLLDHIVIGANDALSLAERGLL